MQEIIKKRSRNAKHYDLGNGQIRTEITIHDQHYPDPVTGQWEDIDHNWEYEQGFGWKVKKAWHNLRFMPNFLRFGFTKGVSVDYMLPLKDATFGGNKMVSVDAWPNTDLVYTSVDSPHHKGVKGDFILKAPGHPTEFRIEIKTVGCTATVENNELVYRDKDGAVVGKIPAPYMTDANYDSEQQSQGLVTLSYDGTFITLTPDSRWLETATYPITLDPTTTIQPTTSATGKDACVSSANPSTNYGNTYLYVGPLDADMQIAYIEFDVSTLMGATINAATLSLYFFPNSVWGTTTTFVARNVTSEWSETLITFNNQPTFDQTYASLPFNSSTQGSKYNDFNVKSIVQNSIPNGTHHGFRISTLNETWNYRFRYDLYGTDSTISNTPKLTIDYTLGSTDTQTPTQPTNLIANPVSQTQVNLSWTASTDNIAVTGYEIWRNGSLLTTTANTTHSDTTVAAGTAYSYYVIAYDAAGNKSIASTITSVITPLPAPIITIQSISNTKISAINGICTVVFRSDKDIIQWEARYDSAGVGSGTLVDSGTNATANTDITFTVLDEELTNGDRTYTIRIYGKNTSGVWSS